MKEIVVIDGKGANGQVNFMPKQGGTRAETAKMVYTLIEKIK